MTRTWIVAAGLLGALGVALGAFGAHGLEGWLEGAEDAAKRLAWWRTGVQYHLIHAVGLGLPAWLGERCEGKAPVVAGVLFSVGVLLFSGTLYAMTLGAPRVLGAVTPLGGLSLVAGWLAVAASVRTYRN